MKLKLLFVGMVLTGPVLNNWVTVAHADSEFESEQASMSSVQNLWQAKRFAARNHPPPPPPPPQEGGGGAESSPAPSPSPEESPPPGSEEEMPPPGSSPEATPLPGTEPSPESSPQPSPEHSPETEPPPEEEKQEGDNTSGGNQANEPPPPAHPPPDIPNLTPEELAALTEEDGGAITPELAGEITPDQMGHIPPKAVAGIAPETLFALPYDTVKKLSPEQVQSISKDDFQNADDNEIGEFLVNLDGEAVSVDDVKDLLPPDWQINANDGGLRPPPKTKINLPGLTPGGALGFFPPDNIPDLNKSFALGGESDTSFLDSANQTFSQAGLTQYLFSQDQNSGRIVFDQSSTAGAFSLAPDAEGISQGETNEEAGFKKNDQGFYVVTTSEQQQLILRPMPVDPAALGSLLNANIHLGERGDVLINGDNGLISAIFSSEVQTAPDGASVGPYQQEDGSFLYIFESGQAQGVYPTPNDPDLLIELLYQHMPDLSQLTYLADGTLTGLYKGRPVIIETGFSGQRQSVDENTDNSSGSLSFSELGEDGSLVLLYRSPIPNTDESSRRARVSDSDVEQRVAIKYDESETESTSSQCLDSSQQPSHFIGFIEEMANCKFIFY